METDVDYDKIFERDEFRQMKRNISNMQDTQNSVTERLHALEVYKEQTLIPLLNDDFAPRIASLEEKQAEIMEALASKLDQEVL